MDPVMFSSIGAGIVTLHGLVIINSRSDFVSLIEKCVIIRGNHRPSVKKIR